jgi:hypothetical protein
LSFFWRIAEERILEAQRAGVFDDLPGKGKPLELEDLSWVPEAELLKDIHTLDDLLKHVEDEGARRALAKSIQSKIIRLDLMRRRSMSMVSVREYNRRLVDKLRK